MTPIKLKNPENQTKFTALLDALNAKKANLIALDEELKALEGKQAKNAATLAAVRNEFETEISKIKAKFDQERELSLDDYAETQKLKAEYTARIDFFNAVGEELQPKLYKKREAVYDEKNAFLAARKALYRFAATALMDEFIEANKAQIALFKGMFVYSCDYNEYTGRDGHDEFNDILEKKFQVELHLPQGTGLSPLALASDWQPKTPTQLHAETFAPQEKTGFKRLLDNM
jgi:hypothetical protein